MQTTISSGILTATIDTFGAELHSIKDSNGMEYLWQADEKVWKRHAPVLFPFICNTASKKYTVNGKEYALANHGFARDNEFKLVSAEKDSAIFIFEANEETLKIYPYKFELFINYKLEGNKLEVIYTVHNTNESDIFFFIGGHPAFRCPMTDDESYNDYRVVYEKAETIIQQREDGSKAVIADNTSVVSVSHELFAHDVFMKDKPSSSWVALESKNNERKVKLHYDNKGCIAVWSSYFADAEKTEAAKFVCLEPWSSTPVYCNDTEELTKMSGAIKLPAGEKYNFSYTIEIN